MGQQMISSVGRLDLTCYAGGFGASLGLRWRGPPRSNRRDRARTSGVPGYAIAPEQQGNSVASEAAASMLELAFTDMHLLRLRAKVLARQRCLSPPARAYAVPYLA